MENTNLIIKNFFKTKKNIVMLSVLFILLPFLLFFNKSILSKEQISRLDYLKEDYQSLLLIYSSINAEKELQKWSLEYPKEDRKVFLGYHNQEIEYLKNVSEKIVPLNIENTFLKDYKTVIELNHVESRLTDNYIRNKVLSNEKLERLGLEEESLRYGTTGVGFLNFLVNIICSLPGMLFLVYIFGDPFGKAYESEKIKLSFTQPKNRANFILSHLFISYIQTMVFLFVFLVLGFFLSSVIYGSGNFDYPVLISKVNTTIFIPIWKYWVRIIFIFGINYLFILVLYQLCVVYFKKSVLSFIYLVIISLLSYYLSRLIRTPVSGYNPFIYLDSVKSIIGIDYTNIKYLSGEHADGLDFIKVFRLFIQNESYFNGENVSKLLKENFSVFKYFFSMLVSIILGIFSTVKKAEKG